MAKKNEAWGIDVGANAIKAVKLVRVGGEVQVEDFDVLPFKQILTTPDLDVDQAIQVGLETLIQKHDMEKIRVVASVPGNMAFARFAKLPPVEPKKIPDIVKFEAQQQIPFPIEEVEWDYQIFQQDDSPDVEVGIFAITKERVMKHLANYRQVDVNVDQLTLSPLAVYNTFNYENQGGGSIYMDIGTVSTDVIIVEDGGIWLRTLPIGGNNFTEALVKQFKISFPKAEKLKREAATSKYAKQIFQAMRAVFADMVQEVQRSLGFYQSINRDSNLTRLVGVGSTFRLPGLQKFLKQQLQLDVVRPDGYKSLAVMDGKRASEFSNHALNMATACGLALQGLGLEKVSANILPSHVLASRMWRAKQPWIAASAACFVAAAGMVGAKHFIDAGTVDQNLAGINSEISGTMGEAEAQVAKWQELQQNSDPRQFIKNIRRMIDHRNIWSRLVEDINAAALSLGPQPELLSNDYEAQLAIPRDQRRRLYIDSIETRYDPQLAAAEGQRGGGGQPPLAQMVAANYTVDNFFTEETAPQFIVTIKGSTPLATAHSELNAKVIQWFKDNAERPDRPYTFKFTEGENPIRSLLQVAVPVERPGGRSARPGAVRGGNRPTYGGGGDPYGGFEGDDDYGGYGGGGFRRGSRGGGSANLTELIPVHPLHEESANGDWQFEIEFMVELKSPLDARPKVDASEQDAPAAPASDPADTPSADSLSPAAIDPAALAQTQPVTEVTR